MVFEELLGRYLSGELSSEEEMRFHEALSQKPELKHRLDEFQKNMGLHGRGCSSTGL